MQGHYKYDTPGMAFCQQPHVASSQRTSLPELTSRTPKHTYQDNRSPSCGCDCWWS